MTTTITKNFISKDNQLFKARVKEGVEQIKKDGKWVKLEERGKYIKTKTLYVTHVNNKSGVKKDFKEGKRYIVNLHSGLSQSAGYIYDESGFVWQLYRGDVGFYTLCQTYLFESSYK